MRNHRIIAHRKPAHYGIKLESVARMDFESEMCHLYNPDHSNMTRPDSNGPCIHKNVKLCDGRLIVI